jgi:pilus assembly protein Flp/PilA
LFEKEFVMSVSSTRPLRRRGQALVEYALLLAGIALVCVVAVAVLGHKTADVIGVMAAVMPGDAGDENHPINTATILPFTSTSGTITLDTTNMGNGSGQMDAIFGAGGASKLVS